MSAKLDCPPGTVPGWLDELGNPTSCVGDSPCPGLEATDCVVVAPEPAPVDELPNTGATDGVAAVGLLLAAAFAIVLGSLTALVDRRRSARR